MGKILDYNKRKILLFQFKNKLNWNNNYHMKKISNYFTLLISILITFSNINIILNNNYVTKIAFNNSNNFDKYWHYFKNANKMTNKKVNFHKINYQLINNTINDLITRLVPINSNNTYNSYLKLGTRNWQLRYDITIANLSNKKYRYFLKPTIYQNFKILFTINVSKLVVIEIISVFFILLLTILIVVIWFYARYKKIYQPLILKEIEIIKIQNNLFKHKKIIFNIYQFIKLNSKKNKYYFWKKYKFNSFWVIQEIFKNNLDNIDYNKYDNIFYHKKNKTFLAGKQFINIFLNCNDVIEYNKKIRINYPNCRTNNFHKILLYDILDSYINKIKNVTILKAETNFDSITKMQLAKIRSFLRNQEWNYYFFDLQNLMHQTIIKFLNWKNKGLNFNAYSRVLKRKLFWILQSELQVNYYLEIVQTINFYRNLLSKVSPTKQDKLIIWNKMNEQEKEKLAWDVYFSLIDFIDFTNIVILKKYSINIYHSEKKQ